LFVYQEIKNLKGKIEISLRNKCADEGKWAGLDCKLVIDVYAEAGSIFLHATPNVSELALTEIMSFIHDEREARRKETLEGPVVQGSPGPAGAGGAVRFVIREGGEVSDIMMAGETRVVKVRDETWYPQLFIRPTHR